MLQTGNEHLVRALGFLLVIIDDFVILGKKAHLEVFFLFTKWSPFLVYM